MLDETGIDAALLAVEDGDGTIRGTAFLVATGVALTCDHVVEGLERVFVRKAGARSAAVPVPRVDQWPGIDVAALRVPGLEAQPLPLARATVRPRTPFFTKGFQWQQYEAFSGPFPVHGTVTGVVAGVSYSRQVGYRITAAYSLADEIIDEGLSGAPLLDGDWGVVIGIVNATTKLPGRPKGFAISLRQSADEEPGLATICEENEGTVPRYGPYLNVAGARAVCKAQRDTSATRLAADRLVALDRYCERAAIAETLERFLTSDAVVLPIVGPSGAGKTTELVQRTVSLQDEDVLLFAAADIAADLITGLPEGLEAGLEAGGYAGRLPRAGVAAIADALREGGRRLLVVLDGLNETPVGLGPTGTGWYGRTTGWLREHEARIILTARPEYWSQVRSQLRAGDLLDGALDGAALGDFSDAEAQMARHRYGLDGPGLGSVRHPLLLRVLAELQDEGERVRPGLYDAVERYIARQCSEAARVSMQPEFVVRAVVERLTSALDAGTLALDRAVVSELGLQQPKVMEALLGEHLVLRTGDEFRFAFDDIAEYLLASRIDARDALEGDALARTANAGALVMVVRRLDRDEGTSAVREVLDRMLDALAVRNTLELRLVAGRCLAAVREAEELEDQLLRFCERIVDAHPFSGLPGDGALLIEGLRVPPALKWAALRVLLRTEHGFEYEWHHWDDFLPGALGASGSTPTLPQTARKLVEADPQQAWQQLSSWLGDRTPLRERAYVQDVAYALMYHFCGRAFDQLIAVLSDVPEVPWAFFGRLADANPEASLACAERWAERGTERQVEVATYLARAVALGTETQPAARGRALAVLRRMLDAERPASARLCAIEGLVALEDTREEVCEEVLERFAADDPTISPYLLGAFWRTHTATVLEALRRRAADEGGRKQHVLAALRTAHLDEVGDPGGVVQLLEAAEPADRRGHDWDFGNTVEQLLYKASSGGDHVDRLAAIAERVIRNGSQPARDCIAYYATGGATGPVDAALRRRLFAVFLELPPDRLPRLANLVCRMPASRPEMLDRLLDAPGARAPEVEAELLAGAFQNDAVARALGARLVEQRSYEPQDPHLRAFAQSVRAGADPVDAVDAILESI